MAGDRSDYVKAALQYCKDVTSGNISACKWVKLATARHLKDLKRKDWPFYFDEWWASDACDFIKKLPHVEGTWDSPTITLEPWQIFVTATVFGWRRKIRAKRDPEVDPRRFNTAYIEVGRKNAKSTWTAGIALYALSCEGEVGPQVKTAATTGKQARIVFDIAKKMVERTSPLREAFNLEAMANAIPCFSNGGSLEPINAKSSTQDGLNPHCTIIDELHAHKDRSLFDVLKSARGARKNPLSWYITTAGYNTQGVCYEQRTLVTKLLSGVLDLDHYFGIIYTLDHPDEETGEEGDEPFDESVWIKSNPNLGVSVQLEEMREYAREAQNSPDSLGEFKTKRLNMWLHAANAWISITKWDACCEELNIEDFIGKPCWMGTDLSNRDDISARCLVFWDDERSMPVVFPRFYLPEELVEELERTTGAHYRRWAEKGFVKLTPGDFIDHNIIEQDIRQDWDKFFIREGVFDPWGSAQMVASLNEDGLVAAMLQKNAANFTPPAKDFESRVKRKKLRHDGNPCMRWMVSNAVVERRVNGSILPKKEHKDSAQKIDGVDAALMGLSRAVLYSEEQSEGVGAELI